jgi:O-antigen ligase
VDARRVSAAVPLGERLTGPTVLGLAIALITATQLRIPGAPLGLGELLLAGWCVLSLLRGRPEVDHKLQAVWTIYWLICFAALSAGALAAIALEVFNLPGLRDGLAHALIALMCFAAIRRREPGDMIQRAARTYCVLAGLGYLACLALATAGRGAFGPVDMWYGLRFRGLAENPNQLALTALPIPFLAYEAAQREHARARRFLYFGAAGAGVIVGVASLSNALMLAWSVGGVLLLPGVIGWLRRVSLRATWGLVRQVALPLVLLGSAFGAAYAYRGTIHAAGQAAYDAGGEGDDRMARWQNGLEAINRSPLVGLGPGSFSGPTAPFQGEEAHNTAIDWMMSTGIVGLLSLLGIIGLAAWRSRSSALRLSLIAALLAFATFHLTLRQPAFWMLILLLTTPTGSPGGSSLARQASLS